MELRPQQYYPTYSFKERDIVLLEFQDAQRIANSQTTLYSQLTSILFGLVTALLALFGLKDSVPTGSDSAQLGDFTLFISLIYFFLCYFILNYFVDLQKTITVNARKVVTLRTMLGLDYGNLQMTLPSSRVEGAVNPFALAVFPGWFGTPSFPLWIIIVSSNFLWYYAVDASLMFAHPIFRWWHISILFSVSYALLYRRRLFDEHESFLLITVKGISRLLHVSLSKNIEYTLFRSKLATYEIQRLKINTSNLERIVIAIEDSGFWAHKGVSARALGRALLSNVSFFRKRHGLLKSGGSTITMQLSRSLIINDYQKTVRRKILEILLAFWIEDKFTKKEILQMYLASVRFDVKAIGLTDATKHFFGATKQEFSNEEAFFLIERLSSIKATYRRERVQMLSNKLRSYSGIEINDKALKQVYSSMVANGKLAEIIN